MECPASAKRGGASAKILRAITAILSSRMWFATVTGPNRHSAAITGAYIRADEAKPGTSIIGIELSMLVSGSGIQANRLIASAHRLEARRRLSNMRKPYVNPRLPALTHAQATSM